MGKAWRAVRVIWAILCIILAVVFLATISQDKGAWVVHVIMAVIFGAVALLLLRRKKSKPVTVVPVKVTTVLEPDVPEETLRDMRKYYSAMQAQGDARVMADSLKLVQQTVDLDTFLSRMQLCQQKALTLLQAEKAGVNGIQQLGVADQCKHILDTVAEAKSAFLDRSSFRALTDAMQLKTPAGQRRKLQAYIDSLEEHRTEFMEVEHDFDEAIGRTKAVMP